MPEIFISYAWNDPDQPATGSREETVDRLCEALMQRGHTVLRDKNTLTYKSNIRRFMERIGAGGYVVAVVSDRYLCSHSCMFEALEMMRHRAFAERVFPIVLPDAEKIFSNEKIEYSIFWKNKKDTLSKRLDAAGRGPENAELLDDERELEEIRLRVQTFISEIARLNVLTAALHLDSNFDQLIAALERKMPAGISSQSQLEKLPDFQAIDVNTLDFDHALRPEFTRSVAHTLFRERRSVNLHAPKGWGRKRLANDLSHALHNAPLRIVRINLHNYISAYHHLLDDLAAQLRLAAGDPDICDIIEEGCRKLNRPVLLVLENLDAVMQPNPAKDPRFNGDFLNTLNGLRNTPYCCLLALSEKPHNAYTFNGVSSWLDVKIMQLPELSDRNIGAEIDRRLDTNPDLRTYVIEQIETEANEPARLLDDLLRYLESTARSKEAAKHFILNYRKKH